MDEILKKKLIEEYLGKWVRITQKNDFAIDGEIEEICGDFIQFKTGVASSLININDVKRIVLIQRPPKPLFEKDGGR